MVTDQCKRLAGYLRERNLRLTSERQAIVDAISKLGGHFDADDVFVSLRQKRKGVSRASVYRTLPLLEDCGLVRRVFSGDRHEHYEYIRGQKAHEHLVCLGCGKVIEFASPKLTAIETETGRKHGFEVVRHRVVVEGYCKECRARAERG